MSLLLSGSMLKLPAAGGGITDPNDVGAVIWLDMTDFTYQKQDTAGTTAVTAASDPVRFLVDRTANTNDFKTASGSNAGTAASGFLTWNEARFIPDTALSGLTTNMEMFVLLNTSDPAFQLLGKLGAGTHYAGLAQDGSSNSPTVGFTGTITYSTDGVDESSPTRDDLHTAWSTGSNVIASLRGIDLSTDTALTTLLQLMAYSTSAFYLTGSVYHIVITPDLTGDGTKRADLIDWLKTEGGIT